MRREIYFLRDAIRHTERVPSFVDGADLDRLGEDPMGLDAVLRNIQIIGEAVKQIPDELRDMRPEIPWTSIAGIRNRLVHRYFAVDTDVIVDICTNHLRPLLNALREIEATLQAEGHSS